jgi:hypothetical protein
MPVTIEPVAELRKDEPTPLAAEDSVLDLTAPVSFEQYGEALRKMHAELIAIAVEHGWDKPSAMARRVTLEMPERRNGKVTPAPVGSADLTQDMFTPEGWAAYTANADKEYAARLVLFRKRILKLSAEGYFDTDIANRILTAGGLPSYDEPKGFRYRIGGGPVLSFTDPSGNERDVNDEINRKFQEFFDANGWTIENGYVLPGTSRLRGRLPIPADETAPLL